MAAERKKLDRADLTQVREGALARGSERTRASPTHAECSAQRVIIGDIRMKSVLIVCKKCITNPILIARTARALSNEF